MPYTAQFFAEKLNVPVEYFNPLRNIQIDPAINLEDLARVAHSLGEVVGLGLRNLAHCPVELNLMPESTLKWQSFNQKKPYLIATVFSLVAVVAAIGLLFKQLASAKQNALDKVHPEVELQEGKSQKLTAALNDQKKTQKDVDQFVIWLNDRYYWPVVMTELRGAIIAVERDRESKLHTPTGLWIENFITAEPRNDTDLSGGMSATPNPSYFTGGADAATQEMLARRYGIRPRGPAAAAPPPPPADTATASADGTTPRKPKGDTNEVSSITVTFRAVGLTAVDANANKDIYYAVLDQLRSNPLFDKDETNGDGNIGAEEPLTSTTWPGTFTFKIIVGLKHPLKL